jgi:phage replication-related protein YjqB (UPF0714/DUF867 family)
MNKYGIIAIHGGNIEKGTSDIAQNIAKNDIEYFINSSDKHITSTEFESPLLNKLLSECEIIISIHGQHDKENSFVMVGGLEDLLISNIKNSLNKNNFNIIESENGLSGVSSENVCNKGVSKKGVQLELSHKLRIDLLNDKNLMNLFVDSIRNCL